MTQLCVSIFVTDPMKARRDIATAAEAGADMVELRIDRFTDPDRVRELLKDCILPNIVTCRAKWEGGQAEIGDAERWYLLRDEIDTLASYVDIELKALEFTDSQLSELDRTERPGIIVSAHDFQGRPDRLYNILDEMNQAGGDIHKIVWLARSIRDNLEAFELLQTRQKPTIALCMGEAGLISRILARKFGAFLTFASLTTDSATAPGQVSIEDMKRLYRWDAIKPDTRIYGVVASPVMHSMSPAIHNAAFDAINYNGLYLPMLVEPGYESFKAFMETFLNFEGLDLFGLSITLPHKENALRYLQEKSADIEPLAQAIGAVNTIIIDRPSAPLPLPRYPGAVPPVPPPAESSPLSPSSPLSRYSGGGQGGGSSGVKSGEDFSATPSQPPFTLRGRNTDYAAILDSITNALGIQREDLSNYRIAVLGAGGTGRTAVAALAHYGATVVVYNRTLERAEELAREFNGRSGRVVAARLEKLCDSCCHIYINTTSVGMYPNVSQSPLGDSPPTFSDQSLVFDTIYNPMKTLLLEQAERAGAKTISGVEMFVRQAAAQFEYWTSAPAPAAVMRRVIEQRLSRA